jgi:hypothetical protein
MRHFGVPAEVAANADWMGDLSERGMARPGIGDARITGGKRLKGLGDVPLPPAVTGPLPPGMTAEQIYEIPKMAQALAPYSNVEQVTSKRDAILSNLSKAIMEWNSLSDMLRQAQDMRKRFSDVVEQSFYAMRDLVVHTLAPIGSFRTTGTQAKAGLSILPCALVIGGGYFLLNYLGVFGRKS